MPRETADLENRQNLDSQSRFWSIERAAWIAMAVFLLVAGLGLLGSGLLAGAKASGDGLAIEYQRFARQRAPAAMRIDVDEPSERIEISFSRDYIEDAVEIERVEPEPEAATLDGDRVVYSFAAVPGRPTSIQLHLKMQGFGVRSGSVGIEGREPIEFRQLVYP